MDTQDRIDAYVKGLMDAAQKAAFEQQLRDDPDLVQAVEQARIDYDVANLLIENDIRGWMKEWSATPPDPNATTPVPPAHTSFPRWPGFAVLLLLAGGLIWYLWSLYSSPNQSLKDTAPAINRPSNPRIDTAKTPIAVQNTPPATESPTESNPLPKPNTRYIALAESRFPQSPLVGSSREIRSNEPAPDVLQRAAADIRKKNYRSAIKALSALPAGHPDYADAQVLLGEAYFHTRQFAIAEQSYQKAAKAGIAANDTFEWQLLMVYLAQYPGSKKSFDDLLQKIMSDEGHSFQGAAETLQKEIR